MVLFLEGLRCFWIQPLQEETLDGSSHKGKELSNDRGQGQNFQGKGNQNHTRVCTYGGKIG